MDTSPKPEDGVTPSSQSGTSEAAAVTTHETPLTDLLQIRLAEHAKTYNIIERQLAHAIEESNEAMADMIRKITSIDGYLQDMLDSENHIRNSQTLAQHYSKPKDLDTLIRSVQSVAEDMNGLALSVTKEAVLPEPVKGQASDIADRIQSISGAMADLTGLAEEGVSGAAAALTDGSSEAEAASALESILDHGSAFETKVHETVHELLSLTQFQDLLRQRIGAVNQTLRLLQDSSAKIARAVVSGNPAVELQDAEIKTADILSYYTMESQHRIHGSPDEALEANEQSIELF